MAERRVFGTAKGTELLSQIFTQWAGIFVIYANEPQEEYEWESNEIQITVEEKPVTFVMALDEVPSLTQGSIEKFISVFNACLFAGGPKDYDKGEFLLAESDDGENITFYYDLEDLN